MIQKWEIRSEYENARELLSKSEELHNEIEYLSNCVAQGEVEPLRFVGGLALFDLMKKGFNKEAAADEKVIDLKEKFETNLTSDKGLDMLERFAKLDSANLDKEILTYLINNPQVITCFQTEANMVARMGNIPMLKLAATATYEANAVKMGIIKIEDISDEVLASDVCIQLLRTAITERAFNICGLEMIKAETKEKAVEIQKKRSQLTIKAIDKLEEARLAAKDKVSNAGTEQE